MIEPAEAAAYIMPFGKHKGKSLTRIATEDARYLDWMTDGLSPGTARMMVLIAVEEPFIKRQIERAIYDS